MSILVLAIVGAIAVVGIGLLIAFLAKQTKGAKEAMEEGRRRQAEIEGDLKDEGEGRTPPGDSES